MHSLIGMDVLIKAANSLFSALENQTAQTLTLNLCAPRHDTHSEDSEATPRSGGSAFDVGFHGSRPDGSPYRIPGITTSLARILGEQVMRSRVVFEEAREERLR